MAKAEAQSVSDVDILNFALNLEYLEAEYYLRAVSGTGIPAGDITGTGALGSVIVKDGSTVVPFATSAVQQFAQEIAEDELAHVRFIRAALQSLGATPVARPTIDLNTSFTVAAQAAGIIPAGPITPGSGPSCPAGQPATPRPAAFFVPSADCLGWVPNNHPGAIGVMGPPMFDPFANEDNFLLGAYVFEDVGVTAYKGAAALIANRVVLEAAAGILAVEAYHAGNIRTQLFLRGLVEPAQRISDLRDAADGPADLDQGIVMGGRANIVPTDGNGIAFSRSAAQVLNIVYLGGAAANFGFFPNLLNGAIQ